MTKLSDAQLKAIDVTERVCSSLSLLGCAFIIITFATSKAFHKPINRLVFYASAGNIMSNIATLIARDTLPHLGSGICQFQGFLIQMFMPADAYWTLAMAVNVYLTFYFKFDASKLRRLEKWYFLLCYGIPFIPAFVYIFIKSKTSRIYSNATLWCWISDEWDVLRITTFYAPVWVVILASMVIYIRAGREIYIKRSQLKEFSRNNQSISAIEDPFTSYTTKEIHVTSEPNPGHFQTIEEDGEDSKGFRGSVSAGHKGYSVNISAAEPTTKPSQVSEFKRTAPIISADSSRPPQTPNLGMMNNKNQAISRRQVQESNNAAWSYTKVAVLFFTAMLITWIPSSANRVYSVVNPGKISPVLEYLSAFVLPLQGFWNAVIYIATSRHACKIYYRDLMCGNLGHGLSDEGMGIGFGYGSRGTRLGSRGDPEASESMTELASVRVTQAKVSEDS